MRMKLKLTFRSLFPAKLEISFEGLKLDKKVTVDNWIANFPTVEFEGVGLSLKENSRVRMCPKIMLQS